MDRRPKPGWTTRAERRHRQPGFRPELILLWVVLREEQGKRRRGTKKEGAQTRPAGNAPRTLSFASQMTEDPDAGSMATHHDKGEQSKGQNLRHHRPRVGAAYE